jgi:acetate kinase
MMMMENIEADVKKVLVINCGSSSLKYEVYQMPHRQSLGKGLVERIGESAGKLTQTSPRGDTRREMPVANHLEAFQFVKQALTDADKGIVSGIGEISGVGHRVVHGGEKYASSVIIDADVIKAVEECCELAPLHNPPNLMGVRAAMELFPDVKQVGVFDTAFHQTMPPHAYLYGIPWELYEKYRIRRYGFHGTSHRYVSARAIGLAKRDPENTNVISCHLGNGASITAIENGVSVDTSMGFTPLEGVMMGTRSGDIDPAILFFLEERGYSSKDLNNLLNKKSGLLGLSGISNDLRDLESAAEKGNKRAQETLEVYAYRIRKYIGAYAANLFKADILVFTGGIGQHGVKMRERICHRLENIGMFMDFDLNRRMGSEEGVVSEKYSPVTIMSIPTNEELQIAIDVYDLLFEGDSDFRRRKSDVNI